MRVTAKRIPTDGTGTRAARSRAIAVRWGCLMLIAAFTTGLVADRAEAAAELGLHPSTLGRAVAGKALLAGAAVVPLDRFFSRALPGADGPVSAFDVQRRIRELVQAAERVEKGLPLSPELDQALQHGTSLGGARPKAQLDNGEQKYIAKFSSTTDLFSVAKAEFIAMRLAAFSAACMGVSPKCRAR